VLIINTHQKQSLKQASKQTYRNRLLRCIVLYINTISKNHKRGSPVQCFNCKVKNFANSPRRLIKLKRLIEKSKKHGPIGTSKIIFCKLNYRQAAVPPVLRGMKHGPPRGMRQSDTQICNSMLILVCRNNISSAVGDFYVFF
jgi:hypothetical protein